MQGTQAWITQFYLQLHQRLPLPLSDIIKQTLKTILHHFIRSGRDFAISSSNIQKSVYPQTV